MISSPLMLRRIAAAALVVVPFAFAEAQNAPSAVHAVLRGVVVDSVRGGYLRGATVGLIGPSRMAFTDAAGRFRIDSIPPGEYQVALFDPLLDSLSLSVVSPKTLFAAGDTVVMRLAVPSQLSIVAAKCGPARSTDDRALVGQVLDAATEQPVSGAQVTLSWTDMTINEQAGVRNEPRRRQGMSDARGFYKICGLPAELSAEAFVQRGVDSTGKVQIALGDALLGLATFTLPSSAAAPAVVSTSRDTTPAPAVRGTGSIFGIVVDGNGKPIDNAYVSITDGVGASTTDSTGAFALAGQPTGTHALVVRRLGYMPEEIAVNLTPLRRTELTVQMRQYVPVLASVIVQGSRTAAFDRIGYTERKARGTGRYIERDFIQNRNAHALSNIIENIPGLRRPGDGFGGTCTTYFVDGVQWRGGGGGAAGGIREGPLDQYIMPDEVEAIEVYSRGFTPAEFRGMNPCATVVIWTRWKLRLL